MHAMELVKTQILTREFMELTILFITSLLNRVV